VCFGVFWCVGVWVCRQQVGGEEKKKKKKKDWREGGRVREVGGVVPAGN
jgi:hypothetical protein